MKTIYKYQLDPKILKLQMPVDANIITAQSQSNEICIWAEIDTEAATEEITFEVFGTGHDIPLEPLGTERKYIGTALLYDETLVLHIYQQTDV